MTSPDRRAGTLGVVAAGLLVIVAGVTGLLGRERASPNPFSAAGGLLGVEKSSPGLVGTEEAQGGPLTGPVVPLPGWPVTLENAICSSATVGLTDAARLQVVSIKAFPGTVHLLDPLGKDRPGWPPDVQGNSFSTSSRVDLDGDGSEEIFFASVQDYVGLRADGTILPGWPVRATASAGGISAPCAIGDLDGDGSFEIVGGSEAGEVSVWSAEGMLWPGWPVQLPRVRRPRLAQLPRVVASPSLGDLDGDGRLEIVVSSRNGLLHVFRMDGSDFPGFPVFNGFGKGAFSAPTVGDITGDGRPEILLAQSFEGQLQARLFAWDRFGQPVQPFPLQRFSGDQVEFAAPTLADLNSDGLIDVLPSEYTFAFSGPSVGRLHALSLEQPYDPRTLEWPTDSHDARHTGLYRPPVDELRLRGGVALRSGFLFLDQSWGGLGVRLDIVDRRRGLAASLARAGLMITQINDRPVAPVRGTVTRQPRLLFRTPSGSFLRRSPRQGSASGVRGDFQVRFDGRKVAEAVLQRLRQAGVQGGEERRVRLKIESPLKDRRRVGGEVRLLVRMPPGG